jgi:tripartite-type tricarboxylate transporter receptor subunit TctC
MIKVSNSAELKEQFGNQGAVVQTSTPEAFRDLVQNEIRDIAPVVKAAGLKVE